VTITYKDGLVTKTANFTVWVNPVLTAGQFVVNFSAPGATVSPTLKVATSGAALGTLPTPVRAGYAFAGWYSEPTGGVKYTSASKVTSAVDVTLFARWTANKYTVTFNANNGTAPKNGTAAMNSKSVTMGKAYGTLPKTTRTGYSFAGWFTAKSGGLKVVSTDIVASAKNSTLYAQWTPKSYARKFNANGGTVPLLAGVDTLSKSVAFGSTLGPLPTTTRTGYKFAGWWTAKTGGEKVTSSTKVNTAASLTLYARWTPNKYTVKFDPTPGKTATKSKSVTYASTYGALPTPTRTGYSFAGWYTNLIDGKKVTSTTKVKITDTTTLYAKWTPKKYTRTFDPKGGSVPKIGSKVTKVKTVKFAGVIGTVPTTKRTGYTFAGWWTGGGDLVTADTKVVTASNMTLYAKWTANKYQRTFNANGGTAPTVEGVPYDSKLVKFAGTMGTLPKTSRAGYTFAGWWTAKSGGDKVTSATKINTAKDLTLYARWTAKTYTTKFNANGGAAPTTNGTATKSKTVTFNASYGTLPKTTRTGYTFTGWWTASSGGTKVTSTTKVFIVGNTTLYAQWAPKVYTIYLSAGTGAVLSPTSMTVLYGVPYSGIPTPTRTGYTFEGWYTKSVGGTEIVPAVTKVTTAADHTIYARWKPV